MCMSKQLLDWAKFGTNIRDPQRINPHDFGESPDFTSSLTFLALK